MRKLLAFVSVLMLTTAAAGQSASRWTAQERLESSPRHHEWLAVRQGQRLIQSFLVYPEVEEKASAVVVIHENRGLTDWVRGVADQLAELGYIAIAPDLLSGLGPGGGRTSNPVGVLLLGNDLWCLVALGQDRSGDTIGGDHRA